MIPQVFPWDCADAATQMYDGALAAVGYESRASFFFGGISVQRGRAAAFVFPEQRVLAFEHNLKVLRGVGFCAIEPTADEVRKWILDAANGAQSRGAESVSLCVDISSMSRRQIATVCFEFWQAARTNSLILDVHFAYSIAEFGSVPASYGPIVTNGPAIEQLAGWADRGTSPCGLILGIGYEEDLALGVMEELEAARVWGFRPKDHDPRYDSAIDAHNRGLFDEIPEQRVIYYSVFDVYSTFISIETLVGLSKADLRMIVVPFGPKSFALASCLAALVHYPRIGIWRVSGGANQEAVDRRALGRVLGLRARFC